MPRLHKIFTGNFPVTQFYGRLWPGMYPATGDRHNGVDYGVPNGTILLAPFAGIAKRFEDFPQGIGGKVGYGVNVEILGEGDWEDYYSILAHGVMGGFLVDDGDHVQAGQPVLVSDNTGFSTAPHTHHGLRRKNPTLWTDTMKGWIDPLPFMRTEITPVKDAIDNLYKQKQLVEWAWQFMWDTAHLAENKFDSLPAGLKAAFEETRTKIEEMRGNI